MDFLHIDVDLAYGHSNHGTDGLRNIVLNAPPGLNNVNAGFNSHVEVDKELVIACLNLDATALTAPAEKIAHAIGKMCIQALYAWDRQGGQGDDLPQNCGRHSD
jgi:hypothetical protein